MGALATVPDAQAQPGAPALVVPRGAVVSVAAANSVAATEGPIPVVTPVSGLLALAVGRGVRFNNPYRLEEPLGDTAESVSLAATYLDV